MKKLLIIGYVWPEPNSSAAGSRMMQLIEIFQKHGYQVSYASPAADSEYMLDLELFNINKACIELNNSSFDLYVRELQPDVVMFDRFMMEEQFSWRVDKECPSALKLLETVDLHCLRYARHQVVKNNNGPNVSQNLNYNNEIALREIASIFRCDISLMISQVEVELLISRYKVEPDLLLFIPFMYDALDEVKAIEKWPVYENRINFVTIGNFRHEPNWDSVLYLKNKIWPLIRKNLNMAELHIYGSYLPKKAQQLHNEKQGFHVKGWANNALETMSQYRICLSPLRFGAGMKGKLADAMLSGTPSITTSIGAESMSGGYEWSGYVHDLDDDIANAAISLYLNKEDWLSKQLNGLKIINKVFNKDEYEIKLMQKVNLTINSLEQKRENNFTGEMLRHHTMKSAMYMSQWIEAKNIIKD